MPALTYDRAVADGITSKSVENCAVWNYQRAERPTLLDTVADVHRYRRQAKDLSLIATYLRDREDAITSSLAA